MGIKPKHINKFFAPTNMPFVCAKALVGLLSLLAVVDLALFVMPLAGLYVLNQLLGSSGGFIYLMFCIVRAAAAVNLRERGTWFICVTSMLVELVMIMMAKGLEIDKLMPAIPLLALALVALVWLLIVRPGGEVASEDDGDSDTKNGKITPDNDVNAWSDSSSDSDY